MVQLEQLYSGEIDSSSFTEPFSGAKYDRAYGAMPANPFRDDIVRARQAGIEREFLKLFHTPPAEQQVPESFQRLFTDDYEIGERRRQMTNFENYMTWRKADPTIPADIMPQIGRYEAGTAEVEDVFDICTHTDVSQGLEVGRVTCPYWQRMEHVADLRADVAEAITARGGRLEPRISPYRSIHIMPHVEEVEGAQRLTGFIVPYKHDIGTMIRPSDGKVLHVVERQIVGIRVDEASGFSQEVLERMHTVCDEKERFNWNNVSDERFEYHLRTTGARGFIEKSIQTDSTEAFLVPESTTVYMFAEDPAVSRSLGRVAFRAPDADDGIAYYNSNTST